MNMSVLHVVAGGVVIVSKTCEDCKSYETLPETTAFRCRDHFTNYRNTNTCGQFEEKETKMNAYDLASRAMTEGIKIRNNVWHDCTYIVFKENKWTGHNKFRDIFTPDTNFHVGDWEEYNEMPAQEQEFTDNEEKLMLEIASLKQENDRLRFAKIKYLKERDGLIEIFTGFNSDYLEWEKCRD